MRIRRQDIFLDDNDEIYFGNNQEAVLWYAGNELRLDHTISGTRAQEGYHLLRKDQMEEYVDTTASGIDEFLDLIDTPTTYSDSEKKYARVKEDGSGLYFEHAIVGVTSSGTEPPDPDETNLWYNTTLNEFFYYDYNRNDWLSIVTNNYLFSYFGNIDGLYMSIGEVKHSYAHYPIPRAATITAVIAIAKQINNPLKGFDIVDDTNTLYSFNLLNWEYSNMTADIDLDAGAKLKVFCSATGARVRNPLVTLEVKRRYEVP